MSTSRRTACRHKATRSTRPSSSSSMDSRTRARSDSSSSPSSRARTLRLSRDRGERGYEAWALHILGAIVRAGDGDAASRSLPARGARHRGQARDAPARRAVRAGTRGEGRR